MTFKEQLANDIDAVFMNLDEFSEIHTVNGKEMAVQIDSNERVEREQNWTRTPYADGIYRKKLLIYVKAEDFGNLPAVGRVLNLDGNSYTILDAVDEDGVYSLGLEANKTGGRMP